MIDTAALTEQQRTVLRAATTRVQQAWGNTPGNIDPQTGAQTDWQAAVSETLDALGLTWPVPEGQDLTTGDFHYDGPRDAITYGGREYVRRQAVEPVVMGTERRGDGEGVPSMDPRVISWAGAVWVRQGSDDDVDRLRTQVEGLEQEAARWRELAATRLEGLDQVAAAIREYLPRATEPEPSPQRSLADSVRVLGEARNRARRQRDHRDETLARLSDAFRAHGIDVEDVEGPSVVQAVQVLADMRDQARAARTAALEAEARAEAHAESLTLELATLRAAMARPGPVVPTAEANTAMREAGARADRVADARDALQEALEAITRGLRVTQSF